MDNELIIQEEMISQINFEADFKAADKRVWKRLFRFESAIYEKILPDVSNSTDVVC